MSYHLFCPKQRFSKEVMVDASGKWLWLRGETRCTLDKGGLSSWRITVLEMETC
uniref:Uncharacterized protein n=1 Tax=Brassica oleracea TaxID=3712 RepID=A0A3P6FLS3_BRAOL|nr:unnamed protein product [Brassica oleracea]